jgi:hypothetical protein
MGVKITPEMVRAWVERTCAEQGVPVEVTDPGTIERIAAEVRLARRARTGRDRSSFDPAPPVAPSPGRGGRKRSSAGG